MAMFSKTPRIRILGDDFFPSELVRNFGIAFESYHDVGDKFPKKSSSMFEFGMAWIEAPSEIVFYEQMEKFDLRISWLLGYVEENAHILLGKSLDIVLDIEYVINPDDLYLRYVDFLSVDQIKKMSELGIRFEISIYPNG